MIKKKKIKKSEDCVLGSRFGLRVGSGMVARVVIALIRSFTRV